MGLETFDNDLSISPDLRAERSIESYQFSEDFRRKLDRSPYTARLATILREEGLSFEAFDGLALVEMEKVNIATKEVLAKYGVNANPNSRTTVLFHLEEPEYDEQQLQNFDDTEEDLPECFHSNITDIIYMRDESIQGSDGKIDLSKLREIYAHELGHRYGVQHLTDGISGKATRASELPHRVTGFYISTHETNPKTNYRVAEWLDEVANIYLTRQILHHMDPNEPLEPSSKDARHGDKPMKDFITLAYNISQFFSKQIGQESKQETLTSLVGTCLEGVIFDLDGAKQFLVAARLDIRIHKALVGVLRNLYSKFPPTPIKSSIFKNRWEEFQDDIGLLFIKKDYDYLTLNWNLFP